jgi:hypothetical protein
MNALKKSLAMFACLVGMAAFAEDAAPTTPSPQPTIRPAPAPALKKARRGTVVDTGTIGGLGTSAPPAAPKKVAK